MRSTQVDNPDASKRKDATLKSDLIIPIYVDTNALLDLLASIEGGFSIVEKVTTKNADASGIDREVKGQTGTEFGIPNVLSLLKLNIGYSANWKKAREEQAEREAERYHTYGSLFCRLRDYLSANSLVRQFEQDETVWESIQPSDFVEIRGVFRPNPFANWLEIVDRLINMYLLFMGFSAPQMPLEHVGQRDSQKHSHPEKELAREARKKAEQLKEFLRGILSDIQSEKIRTFVVELADLKEGKAVVILFLDYLRDQTMTELSNKEYRVLGKIVRKIEKESKESIDLLAGTGMGGIGKDVIRQLTSNLNQTPGLNLPDIETEVFGPALEIVPVAIFV